MATSRPRRSNGPSVCVNESYRCARVSITYWYRRYFGRLRRRRQSRGDGRIAPSTDTKASWTATAECRNFVLVTLRRKGDRGDEIVQVPLGSAAFLFRRHEIPAV